MRACKTFQRKLAIQRKKKTFIFQLRRRAGGVWTWEHIVVGKSCKCFFREISFCFHWMTSECWWLSRSKFLLLFFFRDFIFTLYNWWVHEIYRDSNLRFFLLLHSYLTPFPDISLSLFTFHYSHLRLSVFML